MYVGSGEPGLPHAQVSIGLGGGPELGGKARGKRWCEFTEDGVVSTGLPHFSANGKTGGELPIPLRSGRVLKPENPTRPPWPDPAPSL